VCTCISINCTHTPRCQAPAAVETEFKKQKAIIASVTLTYADGTTATVVVANNNEL
jgi:hypothetical protein